MTLLTVIPIPDTESPCQTALSWENNPPNPPAPYYGGRLIHHYSHGNYWAGRHWSPHPFIVYMYPAFILKFFYSPWNTAMKTENYKLGLLFSKHSIQRDLGTHHLATLDKLEKIIYTLQPQLLIFG